jgi:hypothetical protein
MGNHSATKLKPIIRDYGCRNRLPHDLETVYEDSRIKVEVCKICNKKLRFKKYYKGRVDNRAYLEAHQRSFAQKWGRTKRLYYKIYQPEKTIIKISL